MVERLERGVVSVRVLVVDDQSVVREGLVLVLGLLPGIEVVGSAGDGEAALDLVSTEHPDIVLMDLRMPRMDGVEATRRIRTEHPSTQVVVLTTYSDDESVFAALRAGARGFLTKSADSDEIAKAIATVMRGDAQLDPAVQRRLLETITPPTPDVRHSPAQPSPPTGGGAHSDNPAGGRGPSEDSSAHGRGLSDSTSRGLGSADDNTSHGHGAPDDNTSHGHGASDDSSTHAPRASDGTSRGRGASDDSAGRGTSSGGPGGSLGGGSLPDGLTPREAEVLGLIADGLSNGEIAGRLFISEATVKTHINNLFTKARLRDRAQAVRYAYRHGLAP